MHRGSLARQDRLRRELDRIVQLLRDRAEVRKVILFGSLAAGRVRPDSDIDLIVVLTSDRRFMDRLDFLYRLLVPRVALDLIALTPEEFERMASESKWLKHILATAQVLHAA